MTSILKASSVDNLPKTPFAFYELEEWQNRNLRWCKGEQYTYRLLCPKTHLLPFQIRRTPVDYPITALNLRTEDGTVVRDLLPNIAEKDFKVRRLKLEPEGDYKDYIIQYGREPLTEPLPEGRYYLTLEDCTGGTYYSEVIEVCDFDYLRPEKLVRLVYCNCSPIGGIIYGDGYKNILYLDTEIGTPEYKYDEEGVNDGDGNFKPTHQKQYKYYQFILTAPEFLSDALHTIRAHDEVYITSRQGYSAKAEEIEVKSRWETSCVAEMTIQFRNDQLINLNCCQKPEEDKKSMLVSVDGFGHCVKGDYSWGENEFFCYPPNCQDKGAVDGDLILAFDSNVKDTGTIYERKNGGWRLRNDLNQRGCTFWNNYNGKHVILGGLPGYKIYRRPEIFSFGQTNACVTPKHPTNYGYSQTCPHVIRGISYKESAVEIYIRNTSRYPNEQGFDWYKLGCFSAKDLNRDAGITVDVPIDLMKAYTYIFNPPFYFPTIKYLPMEAKVVAVGMNGVIRESKVFIN
jgi:hypothetical protein